MKSYCIALAAIAAMSFAGAAYAGGPQPMTMSDSEMDKVTAGRSITNNGVIGEAGNNAVLCGPKTRCSGVDLTLLQ